MSLKVAILGATDKPERYAYQAQLRLRAAGHEVFLVNPRLDEIEGIPCYPDLSALPEAVDTVTIYIGAKRIPDQVEALIALGPKRVIFNPETEDASSMQRLEAAGIDVVTACTLVMLRTDQFA